ncbi:MAG: hypothetical protein H6739_34695 [Alphaproteobacteria bacterium]|nr:hypothetical protein [Alphaproteobacteria bacterium]
MPIRLRLVRPATRVSLGALSIDLVEQALGVSLAALLGPLLDGPITQRGGAMVYPLALPEGQGVAIPMGGWGELGVANRAGLLWLRVPVAVAPIVALRLGAAVVAGPQIAGGSAAMGVRLRPGMAVSWPLAGVGEIGVEAV